MLRILFQNGMRILLGSLMLLAGISHLTILREEFGVLVPEYVSNDPGFVDFIVLSSGVIEIALGLAMIFVRKRKFEVGIALALFLILVFAGNIAQYTNSIDAFGLDSDQKRLIRLFFQPLLIFWALWSTGFFTKFKKPLSGKSDKG